ELELPADELRGRPLEEQLAHVLERLRELIDVDDEEVDLPFLVRLIEGHRARHHAFESYRPAPYPGTLLLFRPREIDPEHLRQATAEQRRQLADETLGW